MGLILFLCLIIFSNLALNACVDRRGEYVVVCVEEECLVVCAVCVPATPARAMSLHVSSQEFINKDKRVMDIKDLAQKDLKSFKDNLFQPWYEIGIVMIVRKVMEGSCYDSMIKHVA